MKTTNENIQSFTFEHPLSEKMRTRLRLEYLINNLNMHPEITDFNYAVSFFHLLSDFLDILDRVDIRAEILKDLMTIEKKLLSWQEKPEINTVHLNEWLKNLSAIILKLGDPNRTEDELHKDPLIHEIKRRLVIPGGYFTFDLPSLSIWLVQPQEMRNRQVKEWLSSFSLISRAIKVNNEFLRNTHEFKHCECKGGLFHHQDGKDADLLRIKLELWQGVFPKISGNQQHFAIRFVPFNQQILEPNVIKFAYSCC